MKPTILTPARDQSRGFDCNDALTPVTAAAMKGHGYDFAVRYVRRAQPHPYDLTPAELETIVDAGLGLMVVQHVESALAWSPSPNKGDANGAAAVAHATQLALPAGAMIWCDLEGVAEGTSPDDVIAYLHGWFDVVTAGGYLAGLYVGWHCGLRGDALYHELAFEHYWASYNLDADWFPAVRGVQMHQWTKRASDVPPGVRVPPFQVDTVLADRLGGRPMLLVPADAGEGAES